jgi:hypothetical protein
VLRQLIGVGVLLFGDYDQDGAGYFVSNGIPKRPNDLDYVKYYSNDQIKSKKSARRSYG